MLKTKHIIPMRVTQPQISRNGDTQTQRITLYDVDNDREVVTHVCSKYGNYARWKKVIRMLQEDSTTAILHGENIRYKDVLTIDADSKFEMNTGVAWDDVADIIESRRQPHPMDSIRDF